MGGNKTRDGLKLNMVIKMLEKLPEVSIRPGRNHPNIAMKDGLRPCPIATSTDVKQMVVP